MNDLFLEKYITRHERCLKNYLEQAEIPAERIREAMLYTLFPGGKRLRPLLVYLCGELIDVPVLTLDIIGVAIEIIHCYSLIHDDLPAMDNDDYRRGKPSCHRQFDEATAILAGDGMQALATDYLLTALPEKLSSEQVISVTRELVAACGAGGMVSGQSLDLMALSQSEIEESKLRTIHYLKTGKLILACIKMVIAAGKPEQASSDALIHFANHLGLVFQMQDDYLDRYESKQLGKKRLSDLANQKLTYASLYTQEALLALIESHYQMAQDELSLFGQKADYLNLLLNSLQARTRSTSMES